MPIFLIPAIPQLNVDVYVEARERFERRLNKDFDITKPDNRGDLFSRWRIGAQGSYGKSLSGEVQFQYAGNAIWTKKKNYGTENRDISLAYLKYKSGDWTTSLGRQKINIGQQRLIGSFEWNNVGRTYDGLRIQNKNWDFFAGRIGLAFPLPAEARVAGIVHMDPKIGNTMLVFKHDEGTTGKVDIQTLDHSFARSFGALAFEAEGALQVGKNLGKDQRAWALHTKIVSNQKSFKPYLEFNAASGGSDSSENRAFDNLYPTNHGKFGIADMCGWKNIEHLAVGTDYSVNKNLNLKVSWNHFRLQDAGDAWYGASGAPNSHGGVPFKDPTGASGRELGSEFDFDATYTFSKNWSVSSGLAIFNPGGYVQNLTGRTDRQVWGYIQLSAKF
ncbi:MAG: alginate export family protein [Fimbriimonadaceae bacterium]|nr:alginate export family protein [Fimbriimonadaceae bacterium]